MRRILPLALTLLAHTAAPTIAHADVTAPRPAALVGVTQQARIAPSKGFVDDAVAFDGVRLAYINTDGATFADLIVHDINAGDAADRRFPVPPDLGVIASLRFLPDPEPRLFAIGHGDDGSARAALIALDGKVVRRFGPANDITLVMRAGAPRVALHRAKVTNRGGTQHQLELVELDKGKRVGKLRTIDVDGAGDVARLELHVNHWTDGFTHAIGTKGGHWDRKEDQRTPDVYADYDVLDGTFTTAPVDDVMALAKRMQILAARTTGEPVFVRMADDLAGVELWKAGTFTPLELDQPIGQYDTGTLAGFVDADAHVWLAMKVDPVNAAAVKKKIADPEYLDLFAAAPEGTKAVRRARVLVTPKKLYRWGVASGRWWLLERSVGFDRGGTSLTIYKLDSPG